MIIFVIPYIVFDSNFIPSGKISDENKNKNLHKNDIVIKS